MKLFPKNFTDVEAPSWKNYVEAEFWSEKDIWIRRINELVVHVGVLLYAEWLTKIIQNREWGFNCYSWPFKPPISSKLSEYIAKLP